MKEKNIKNLIELYDGEYTDESSQKDSIDDGEMKENEESLIDSKP